MSTPITERRLQANERAVAFGGRVLALADHLAQFSESLNGADLHIPFARSSRGRR